MYQDDIHTVAADFLKALERGTTYREERLEPVPVAIPVCSHVALKREETPYFFAGFKPSGRPVFTHDLRLAKSFDPQSMTLAIHVNQLNGVGQEVEPHPTVWIDGRHFTEGHKQA